MKRILFSLLAAFFCCTIHADKSAINADEPTVNNDSSENKGTISEELLAVASQVLSQTGLQTQGALGGLITTAIGSVAHNFLSSAQNAFGDVNFTNNVTIGDEPTDLLTVVAHAQFMNGVLVAGDTTLGSSLASNVTINGKVNDTYLFSKPLSTNLTSTSPLCTFAFQGPNQSALMRLTVVGTEDVFTRVAFLVSNKVSACRELTGTTSPLTLSFSSNAANTITINGISTSSLTNGMAFIELLPSANASILSFS